MTTKKLYKSAVDKKICGVCAGIAEYFKIDPTLIRLIWLFFSLSGGGIIAYIICAIIIPEDPLTDDTYTTHPNNNKDNYNNHN